MAFVSTASSQALTITLAPADHHGYNISCSGGGDGAIDLSVTGGTPPYTYVWSTGATTQDVTNLRAGFISVLVRDAGTGQARADRTLTEPDQLRAEVEPYLYASGFNISCYSCYNGSIQVTTSAGVTPYTYAWGDGPTTEDRTQLDAGSYDVEITDANGCLVRGEKLLLTQSERDDWSKSGNAGSDPNTNYIGTSDNKDVVFKSNGQVQLRLLTSGAVQAPTIAPFEGSRLLAIDSLGNLRIAEDPVPNGNDPYSNDCPKQGWYPWTWCGNTVGQGAFLGTLNEKPLVFASFGERRMSINSSGKLVYGTDLGSAPGFNIIADGSVGMQAQAVVGVPLSIKRNQGDYIRFTRSDGAGGGSWVIHNGNTSENQLAFHFYPQTGDPLWNRLTLWNDGKVSIGNVSTNTDYDYGLYVADGILTKRVKVAIPGSSEWSDHVFKPGYRLLPLPEVAEYIGRNGHLPGVPSADCMVEDGLDVAQTDAMLMEKVEELTLHAIDLNKRLERAEQIIGELVQRLSQSKE